MSGTRVGITELEVLGYLALNNRQFIQHIQRGLSQRNGKLYDYSTINKAVKRLAEEKELVEEKGHEKTEKNVSQPVYGLTDLGVYYVLSSDKLSLDINDVIKNYWEYEMLEGIKELSRIVDKYLGLESGKELIKFISKTMLLIYDTTLPNLEEAYAMMSGNYTGWLMSRAVKLKISNKKLIKMFEEMAKSKKFQRAAELMVLRQR